MEKIKSCVASFIYRQLLNAVSENNHFESFWSYLREKFLKVWDPQIILEFGNVRLNLLFSHNLPLYYCKYKNYDRLLPELCVNIRNHEGTMKLIDVGANIGDTAALVSSACSGKILCIEGDNEFIPLLEYNVKNFEDSTVTVVKSFCSDNNAESENYVVHNRCGTACLTKVEGVSDCISLKTLDAILDEYSEFKDANILKIDTDGFEPQVLNGGKKFLAEARPLVFFEFTPQISPSGFVSPSPAEEDSFKILSSLGYERALFYDNFGNICREIHTSDSSSINDLVSNIDLKKICYYDVLCCHKDKKMHNQLLDEMRPPMCIGKGMTLDRYKSA